jgi:hypothetical protein
MRMKNTIFILVILISFFISFNPCLAQENEGIDQVVYLIGNTATSAINESHLASLKEQLTTEESSFTLLHLGDIVNPEQADNWTHELDLLFKLTEGRENSQIIFTPGDKDWSNSGQDGLRMVKKLEIEVEQRKESSNIFLPSEGCPGPEVIDLSPQLRLIVINTQWWLHPYDIPEAPDADCNNLTKEEFIESLEETIEESEGRNILIVGHHPVVSSGVYGGHMTLQTHLFPFADTKRGNRIPVPLVGSFHAAYRQNVGTVRDMANESYQDFINHMSAVLSQHPGLIYVSAHDYSLQLLKFRESYQIISGSINEKEPTGKKQNKLFSSSNFGYTRLEYHRSGEIRVGYYEVSSDEPAELYSKILFRSGCDNLTDDVIPVNRFYIPCLEEEKAETEINVPFPIDSAVVIPGSYPAKGLKKVLLGPLHRETWQTPVKIPYLNLDTTKTGLTPFALGGGRQTITLKFKANNGYEYAFRSVDKNLVNAIPEELRNTFVGTVIKEATAVEYPYGAIIASSLMDETDILHARPKLYVLPDHPGLGAFREPFAGLFGMLEDRPKDPEDEIEGFMGADDVTRSVGLLRKLYKDNDNIVDAEALGKARAFDMFIGDWGRHEDNWKWAGYDRGDKRVYYPIPRDRDHAFYRMNGLIPYMANREWAMPMAESFDSEFHGIKSLTWPARHVDRFLLTELDRSDWKRISSSLANSMTDEVIDQAITSLPTEILPVSGYEIGEMLKSRKTQLPDAVDQLYMLLARQVDVVGSNKHELVEVERLENGNVRVDMFKRNKVGEVFRDDPMYGRVFDREETREICIYGLDGADVFKVNGSANKSILVRIIGGPGPDEINDESSVKGPGKHTLVYDTKSTILNLGPDSKNKTSDDPGINLYDRKSFKYNTYFPTPLIYYSSDDGLVGSFGINWTRHGFRKDEYKSIHDFNVRAGTVGTVQLGMQNRWKEVLGNWDAGINADYGHYFPYYNYFGLGNNTVKEPELFDDDYYQVNLKGLITSIYAENEIFKKGFFKLGLLYENLDATALQDSIFYTEGERIPGADRISLGGINARIYMDFRDRQTFATRGIQFLAENTNYTTLDGASGNFGLAETYLKYFGTKKIFIPITMVLKLGGSKNYGEQIPFYKYTYLGQFSNLRGYKRNRFTGDASAYLNSELRFHLGKVNSSFIPFEVGLIGFYDVGKVWYEGSSEGGWHAGYGAGFYIAPLSRDYLFTVMFESSAEEKLLFRFGFGFMLDN